MIHSNLDIAMKKILFLFAFLFSFIAANAQTYIATNGTTTYNTCSGTFYDSGGPAGNYGNNENSVTTFCATGGQCIQVNITGLSLRPGDILTAHDGPTTADPQIGGWTSTTVAPGVLTSTTGCLTLWFTSNGSTTRAGWVAQISCITCPTPADYTHPTIGINNEYVGSCLVTDCGPSTYADDGDTYGNYSTNINQIYRVFCPDQAGQCMSVTFNSFNVEPGYDFLLVKDGPTQNSPDITTPPASATNYAGITGLNGDLTASTPFTYTSTDASGCLTFRFYSDNTVTAPGWDATLTCVPCAGGPSGTDPNDCMNLIPLCSGASVPGDATGPGIVAEGCTGSACPAGGENHTIWYMVQAQTTGTIGITLTPIDPTDDYDFAVYGPNATCASLGSPLRCTDSGATGTTGTGGDTDFTEDVTGNAQLADWNAVAGESFIIVVDEWSPNLSGTGYNLSFHGTASLDCTILPVELTAFEAEYSPETDMVDLHWSTASERNNDRFELERSTDGVNYEIIKTMKGAGTTDLETHYYTVDPEPFVGVNYYRLNQWDINGNGKYSDVVSVNILDDFYDMLSLFPNPTTGLTDIIFNSYTKGEAILRVTGTDGKVIINTPIESVKGGNKVSVDLSGQDNGVYMIDIVTRDKSYKARLIKQ